MGCETFRVSVPTAFATGSGADDAAAARAAAIENAAVTFAAYLEGDGIRQLLRRVQDAQC